MVPSLRPDHGNATANLICALPKYADPDSLWEPTERGSMIFGILGLVIFVLDIVAIIDILGGSGSAQHKLLWFIVVFFLPVLGMILYFLIGKNRATDL
jgi:hypothetical protein